MLRVWMSATRDSLHQLTLRTMLRRRNFFCAPSSLIRCPDLSRIATGENCSLGDYSILDISDQPGSQERDARLQLGNRVFIGEQCNIRASASSIEIGDDTMIANNVVIVSANHLTALGSAISCQAWDDTVKGVKIGSDCWIGSNSTLLAGTIIGNGSIIAAGAVVRGDIPPNSVWGGVPARYIKNRG